MRFQSKNSEFHLSREDVARLIRNASTRRDRLMVSLFAFTAIRRAELRLLETPDLYPERNAVLVRHGKGGKQRLVYIPARLTAELKTYCQQLQGTFLFPGRWGGPMSLRNINYILKRAGELAGIQHPNPRYRAIGPHLLRHTFARNWKSAGGSLESLQKILGHSSLRTTLDVYGTESELETAANYRCLLEALVGD